MNLNLLKLSLKASDFLIRVVRGVFWPKVELLIRLWLARIFVVSGLIKLTNWQTALDLATHEYPVSFMSPVTAAYVGVSIEVVGGALFAVGLMTRYAACLLLLLTLVIQFAYKPFDSQLFWAALFGWYAVNGAGPISVDSLLRRGLRQSAFPGVPDIIRASEWIRLHVGPWYLFLMRVWLAVTLLVVASHNAPLAASESPALAPWLPLQVAASLPAASVLICALLFLSGVGVRYVAAAAIVALSVDVMMDPRVTDAVYLLMVFSIFIIYGAGACSWDRLFVSWLEGHLLRRNPRNPRNLEGAPRVVIIGGGFGGMSCAMALRKVRVSVTLIDRENYHLFQPLLYQVATAALSPGDIAAPIRPLFRDAPGFRVLLGEVTGVQPQEKTVSIEGKKIPYDYLVLATGARHGYFGQDGWAPFAPGLKRIEDAIEIRRRILTAFEKAEAADEPDVRRSLLTFLIVGGGPTGVELAGAIAELARYGMDKEFQNFDPARARVIIVQSAPRLLPAFPAALAAIAQRSLERLGVEVLLGRRVNEIDATGVALDGVRIAAATVVWAAGVTASPASRWLNTDADSAGRIRVGTDLAVPGMPDVFAIGDTAACNAWNGRAVPGLAPAAKQGGAYVARVIGARIEARTVPAPFEYHHRGSLATIGRKSAVADFGFLKLWGAPAWWLWGLVHIGFLVGVRNRLATMLNWFWAYLTIGTGIRLITGTTGYGVRETDLPPDSTNRPILDKAA